MAVIPPKTPPIILYMTPISGFLGSGWLKQPDPCPATCTFTESTNKFKNASAIIFHIPGYGGSFPQKANPKQQFVGLSMESEMYYHMLKDKKYMAHFDMTMTYKLSSDITTCYMSSKANYSADPAPKTDEALASVFVSNSGPLNQRNDAIKALMELMPIHSFGKYLHNKDMGSASKKEVLTRYKFHFAFENSNTQDYVTEKVYHALAAGTLPVYLGAPNIDLFVPEKSIIKLEDFESYEKLADYLQHLATHDDEYQAYFEWKKKPYTGNFAKLKEYIKVDARCKLCMFLNGLPLPKLNLQ